MAQVRQITKNIGPLWVMEMVEGFRVQGSGRKGFRVQGSGSRVRGLGFWVDGLKVRGFKNWMVIWRFLGLYKG